MVSVSWPEPSEPETRNCTGWKASATLGPNATGWKASATLGPNATGWKASATVGGGHFSGA